MSLSPALTFNHGTLHDTAIGANHVFNVRAQEIMQYLVVSITYRDLKRDLDHIYIAELLGFLNCIGALCIQRAPSQWLYSAWQTCMGLVVGVVHVNATKRWGASHRTICYGVVRACLPVVGALCTVIIMLLFSGIMPPHLILTGGASFGLLFLGSLIVHEWAHLSVIRRGYPTPIVLQRGMRIGIVRPLLLPRLELQSALAGPAAGIAFCLAGAAVLAVVDEPWWGLTGAIVSLFHMASLLPWYGDGAALRRMRRGTA